MEQRGGDQYSDICSRLTGNPRRQHSLPWEATTSLPSLFWQTGRLRGERSASIWDAGLAVAGRRIAGAPVTAASRQDAGFPARQAVIGTRAPPLGTSVGPGLTGLNPLG
ncbi:hypothetical protein ACOMHN_058003 [Nucella lapillus]